jgi:hypothetical protein
MLEMIPIRAMHPEPYRSAEFLSDPGNRNGIRIEPGGENGGVGGGRRGTGSEMPTECPVIEPPVDGSPDDRKVEDGEVDGGQGTGGSGQ